MNNKNQLGLEFFAVLGVTFVVLFALVISLLVITLGDKNDLPEDDEITNVPEDTSAINVSVNKNALFPTNPSKTSYTIGRAADVKTVSDIRSQNTILVDLETMTSIAEKNADARANLLHEAEKMLLDDMPVIPIIFNQSATVTSKEYQFPSPSSTDGIIRPITAAASMTPAAKERIISFNLWDGFLKKRPISAPTRVAPPTPTAVSITASIFSP